MQNHKLEVGGCATWYLGHGLSETKKSKCFWFSITVATRWATNINFYEFRYNLFKKILFMHFLVLAIFGKNWKLKNIAYVIFCSDVAKLLKCFNNISDRFRNILVTLQYFQGIFLQYFLNISVLCWRLCKFFPCSEIFYHQMSYVHLKDLNKFKMILLSVNHEIKRNFCGLKCSCWIHTYRIPHWRAALRVFSLLSLCICLSWKLNRQGIRLFRRCLSSQWIRHAEGN